MRICLLLLIGALIFASGCTGGGVHSDKNNGLAANSFAAEPSVAEATDNVRFYLDIENVGGTTATCITSQLYGVDGWYDALTGEPIASPPAVLIPQKGITFNIFNGGVDFCYYDITKASQICASYRKDQGVSLSAFLGDSFLAYTNQFCSGANSFANQVDSSDRLLRFQPSLTPPLPERNKAGQGWNVEWVLRPPLLPEGLKVEYPVTARTEYFYQSNAQTVIRAFNKAEFKTRQITGDQSINPSPLQVDNVFSAPIQVAATRGDNPMIINQDPALGAYEYFSYTFEFQNVGNGYPLSISGADIPGGYGPETERGFVIAVASINGPGAFFSNCLGQSGESIVIPPNYMSDLVKIRSDRRAPFGCQIGIDKSKWISRPLDTITITFQIFYRYYMDQETTVTVVGPQRF